MDNQAGFDPRLTDRSDHFQENADLAREIDPDFTDTPLNVDAMDVSEDAESPFYPPTDPPVRVDDAGDPQFLGGFSPASTSSVRTDRSASDGEPGDEAIRDAVRRELREDAATADLRLWVRVAEGVVYLRGTVAGIEDVESAEEVAARVPGVREVIDEINVAGL